MYGQELDRGGGIKGLDVGVGPGCLATVAAVALFALAAFWLAGEWEAKRADHESAAAMRVEALTARDREGNLHREYMFQAWTVALAAFSSSNQGLLVVVAALLGAACAVLVVGWWERRAR